MKTCPNCGLNLQSAQRFSSTALSSGSLYVKVQNFIQDCENSSITEEQFESRLNQEWELTETLIQKYSQALSPELAPICSCLAQALSLYQKAIIALGEEKNSTKALKLAHEADSHLAELDNLQKELKTSQNKIQG
jgi:hypothetical protein